MSKVIVITSGKGGVGKSSISVNLAYALCDKDYRVCLIDADFGLKNLDVMLGLENRTLYDMQDIIEGKCTIEQAMIKDKRFKNLSLLPACKSLQIDQINSDFYKNIINVIKKDFDYILIDSPAGIEKGFNYAISLVQSALIVVNLDMASLRDADRVVGLLMKEGIYQMGLIINKVNEEDIALNRTLTIEDAKDILSLPIMGIVYDEHEMIEANNKGTPLYLNKNSSGYLSFKNIVSRMEGKEVPFLVRKKKNRFIRWLKMHA